MNPVPPVAVNVTGVCMITETLAYKTILYPSSHQHHQAVCFIKSFESRLRKPLWKEKCLHPSLSPGTHMVESPDSFTLSSDLHTHTMPKCAHRHIEISVNVFLIKRNLRVEETLGGEKACHTSIKPEIWVPRTHINTKWV